MVLQALYPSSNCLYTKSKSTMLRPLKGELGYELSPDQNDQTSTQAPLAIYYRIDLRRLKSDILNSKFGSQKSALL